jgi:phage terminase small subunit
MALTIKQQNFCLKYIETGTATEAYYFAYDAENSSYESARVNASKMLADANIVLHIESLRKPMVEAAGITLQTILDELAETRTIALAAQTPQTGAAVSASMGRAKLSGLDKELGSKENPFTNNVNIKVTFGA